MPSSRSVFLHVGLPKTGTTFLQRVLGESREAMKEQGMLYPGLRNDHFFEAQDVLKRPFRGQDDDRVPGAWQALLDEVQSWSGACLVSHELFTVATPEQVREVVDAFRDRTVEVVVTARDLARQLTANWQETVKNGQTPTLAEYVARARTRDTDDDTSSGFWYWQDLPGVLARWLEVVPAERVHVVTVPPRGAPPGLLLQRFAGVLGVELPVGDLTGRSDNASLGIVETEFIRRLNVDLHGTVDWPDYRTYVKQFLAQRALPRFEQSGPIALSPADQHWAAECSKDVAGAVATLAVRVHGDLTDLESPTEATSTEVVGDEAVAEVGVRAIAQMLRRIGREHGAGASTGRTS